MIKICDKDKCTGCGTCVCCCSKNAISMQPDEYGFLFPLIDLQKCVECGICVRVCPQNRMDVLHKPLEVYAAWNVNKKVRMRSSSGGIAAGFYGKVLEMDYYICGTKFDQQLNLKYYITNQVNEKYSFSGSKYVQSYAYVIFKEIRSKLKDEKKVLFIGTPCQVAGLYSFLQKRYDNLITVDLICHGVPSQQYLRDYIKTIDDSKQKKSLSFREEGGWFFDLVSREKHIYKKSALEDLYYRGFLEGLFYRNSCYSCKYAQNERVSDITIGDFWGLGKVRPVSYPTEKVSIVMLNTNVGLKFWEKTKDQFVYENRPFEEALIDNAQLSHPSIHHKKYSQFKKCYLENGFKRAAKSCLRVEICKFKINKLYEKVRYKLKKV